MFIKKTFKVAADMKELETVTSCVRKILDEQLEKFQKYFPDFCKSNLRLEK